MKELDPHIAQIFQKYLVGKHTAQELDVLLAHFGLPGESEDLKSLIVQQFEKEKPSPIDEEELNDMLAEMEVNIQKAINPPVKIKRYKWWYAAASIFLISLIGTFAYISYKDQGLSNQIVSQYGGDVMPGTNRAIITLSDGSRYELNGDKQGIAIGENGISYTDGSLITTTNKVTNAEINVPRGGIYQVTLPDGTKVFLNSESTLHYPVRFTGPERKVELKGEGYFEVAPNVSKPFIVSTNGQELKVLGTHFNLQAYPNEAIGTTLLEGSIELIANNRKVKLNPGEQAVLENNSFKVTEVSADDYTAWTRNQFYYNLVPLHEIFKQMERWYDVEIEFPTELGEEKYFMKIPKDRKLSEVLSSVSSLTNIKFTIEGRRVMVRQ